MKNQAALPLILVTYGVCGVVALLVGYLLATPTAFASLAGVGLVLGVLAFPVLMRWHHPMLLLSWNAALVAGVLPGQPSFAFLMAGISLFFHFLNRSLHRETRGQHVGSVAWSLIFVAAVVFVTAVLTGGIAGRAFGSELWGAKRYLGVLAAIVGYFALVSQPIPAARAQLWVSLFFLSGTTAAISNLIFLAGPGFYFLYIIFPTESVFLQATTQDSLTRLPGISWASLSVFYYMLARFGIQGVFDLTRPWRLAVFVGLCALSLLGGFRTAIVIIALVFTLQFYLEGLFRTRLFWGLLAGLILGGALLVATVDRLPLSVQRSLSFLPLNVDPVAKTDARSTIDWRVQMWRTLLPEVPKYLLLGKGFTFSGTDFLLTQEAVQRGMFTSYEDTLINGNYHSGPLTLIIPFGIFGVLGFGWFCVAALRVLYRNYRYGEASLKTANTFLLAFFIGRLLFYIVFYGQFDLDLMVFTGTVGLSISLNHGIRPRNAPTPIASPSSNALSPA